MNDIFFPKLFRREIGEYHNTRGCFYADYTQNYEKIADDCFHRCVYCDATEKECGGDHFSLDHFRPRKVFSEKFEGVLMTHPHNLYLSCQKCNVLKSDDWKGCIETADGPSFYGVMGYIDRFHEDFQKYIGVNAVGGIVSLNEKGPGNYMIEKMLLNRVNRVYIRRKRLLSAKTKSISYEITQCMSRIIDDYNNGNIDDRAMVDLSKQLMEAKRLFDSLL